MAHELLRVLLAWFVAVGSALEIQVFLPRAISGGSQGIAARVRTLITVGAHACCRGLNNYQPSGPIFLTQSYTRNILKQNAGSYPGL